MNHSTTNVKTSNDTTAIVLVGPPASGKSTLRSLFSDYDVVGCDLESFHDAGNLVDEKWKQCIDSTIETALEQKPSILCVEGAISDEEVDYIRDNTASTFVIHVDVPDDTDRIERHVEREIDTVLSNVVTDEEIAEIETGSFRRHHLEKPYPNHDVTILNKSATSTSELSRRCGSIVSIISDNK